VVIVAQLTFSLPLRLPKCLGWYHADHPSSAGQPFSAAHFFWALLQANSCVLQLRGFCFPGSIPHSIGFPPIKQPLALEAEALAFVCPRKNGAEKGDIFMSYLYRVSHTVFQGQGWIRPVYFVLLTSHTILAIVIVSLILITLRRGLAERFDKHKVIAKWTLPLWFYLCMTGVIVYWMVYQLYAPIRV
jgi:hypothetical protein